MASNFDQLHNGGTTRLIRRRWVGVGVGVGVLLVLAIAILTGYRLSASTPASSRGGAHADKDYNMAESYRGQTPSRCDRAIPLYLSAISKNPMYVHAYTGLGLCYATLGEFDQAIFQLDKAIQIDPTGFDLYRTRAGIQYNNGSAGAAIDDERTALTLATNEVATYRSIAGDFNSYGDWADAIVAMDRAISVVSDDPTLYTLRGDYYHSSGDDLTAFNNYTLAIAHAGYAADRATVYDHEAGLYSAAGQLTQAFQAITTAITLQPNNALFYFDAGQIYQRAGDFTTAFKLYDHYLQLAPSGSTAESALEAKGDMYQTQGRFNEALHAYQRALPLTAPTDPFIRPRLVSKIKSVQQLIQARRG